MKRYLCSTLLAALLCAAPLFPPALSAQQTEQKTPNFFSIVRDYERQQKRELRRQKSEGSLSKKELREADDESAKFQRWKWFWESRVDAKGNFPHPGALMREWEKSAVYNAKIKMEGTLGTNALAQWKQLGPAVIPAGGGTGRINCVRPYDKSPSTIWVGTAAGGAWKTTDAGNNWAPMTDYLPTLSVSDVAIHPNSVNTVYIATGDANPGGSYIHYSAGILRSDDGGKTWNPTGMSYQQASQNVVKRLLISPATPNLMLAGANNGIFLSSDAGVTWKSVQSGNIRDMEYKPNDALTVYACTSGSVLKSTNAGLTWTQLTSTGITGTGNLEIAVTPANPNYVYIVGSNGNGSYAGVWLSTDAGATWKKQSSTPNLLTWSVNGSGGGGQGTYDLAIAVPRAAAGTVVVGGVNIWRSSNSAVNWDCAAHWSGDGGKPYVHADVHDLVYTSDGKLYAGTDGGIFLSQDGGTSWVDMSKGLCITQYYRMAVGATNANMVLGGAQDNGTSRYNGSSWRQVIGGDGMNCIIDYKNANIQYGSIYNGNLYRSSNGGNDFVNFVNRGITGENGAWVTPFQLHPANPNTAYAGFSNVWRTTDAGGSWAKISSFSQGSLTLLEISEANPNYIYAGNDNGFRYTTDGGATWKSLTLTVGAGAVRALAIDPKKPNRIWIGISGFGTQKVLESSDFGVSWKNVSAGLPAIPVSALVYQKNSPDRMYAGTDAGVYYRDSLTGVWVAYNDAMPATIVTDLEIQYASGKLYAGTFGRGIWVGNLANCNTKIDLAVTQKGNLSFCDGDSVVLTAQSGYGSYLWTTGATTPSITVKISGTYSVSAITANGCPATSNEFVVSAMPRTKPNITFSKTKPVLCSPSDSIQLSATVGFGTYRWNNGDTLRRSVIRQPGKYVVSVTKPGSCDAASDTIEIKLATPSPATISRNGNTLTANPPGAGYEWFAGGEKIPNATGRTFTPTETSLKISVAITDTNGCRAMSEELALAAEEYAPVSGEFSVTPNPTSGDVLVSVGLPSPGVVRIEIVTADGKIVRSRTLESAETQFTTGLTMSDLAAGVYYLRVSSAGREWKQQIVKQ